MVMLQMTWQPSLLKSLKRKHGAPPLGLRNLGNSCYLNSVLQCLTYTPPLADFCLRFLHSSICDFGSRKEQRGDCPFCILEKRIARSLSSEAVSDAPLKMNSSLRVYAEHFRSGRQEDAHEFLRYVIDSCHTTCLRLKKLQQHRRGKNCTANGGDYSGTAETVVKEIFGGALQSQVKCLSCGAESNKVDEIMDISLDILHTRSLREAFQKFFQPEILDGNNKYKCDSCKELVAARKQMSILQAPNVLVIQLKRFEGMFGGKVDNPIVFDEVLALSSHMCKGNQDQHPVYNLFGTIVHSGFSPDSGHYYAYIKDTVGRWYCCNDSYVSVSTLEEVLSEKAYILFFSRAKQGPQTNFDVVENGSKGHASNGSKMSVNQKSDCLDKPANSRQVLNCQPEMNSSTNGTRLSILKSDCVEKQVNKKISANHSESNNLVNRLVSNGTKSLMNQTSSCVESPCTKEFSHDYSQTANSVAASVSKHNYLIGGHTCAFVEPVDGQESLDLCQTNNVSKSVVGPSNQHRMFGNCAITNTLGSTGNFEIAVKKKESKDNGYPEPVTSVVKEKTGLLMNERNGVSKRADVQKVKRELNCLGVSIGENVPIEGNGSFAVDPSGGDLPKVNGYTDLTAAQKRAQCQDSLDEDFGSSDNLGMKRKLEDNHSCIFLARDDQSCAKVEAFKEMIGKEASTILRASGWSSEVYSFMHARKKLCQGPDSAALNDHDRKSLLISHAQTNFRSKVPEKLKAILIERLRLFSQGKQSSRM